MRPTYILLVTMAVNLMPLAAVAQDQDRYDCVAKCAEEKSARDAACPASLDSERDPNAPPPVMGECMKKSQAAYTICFRRCPPPALAPPPSTQKGN